MDTKIVILNQDDFICLNDVTKEELEAWFNTPDVPELSNGWYEDHKGNLYEDFEQSIGE